ncbi:unnamed protein product [Dracunculus medinensis]|uniref:RNA helicase n=1 Tax=Dracunculus medinensis TaxID=318479 RepID=A0A158Q3F6_DRAME|nr:unnamed protein product [Dracunculus medinensis]
MQNIIAATKSMQKCDMEDDLQDVRAYFKKNVSNTLQEKIEKMRNKLSLNNIHVDNEVDDGDNGIVQEMRNVNDSVRNKKSKKRPEKSENAFFDESVSAKSMSASSCCLNFAQMNLSRPLLKAINNCGFIEPTPIQAACIPLALAGRDLCACAATGTGKTAAFMLPILERLLYKPQRKSVTRVIILVPTRELAIQVFQVSRRLAQFVQVDICLCAENIFY